jgi:DNA replication and repair protein RecF
VFVRRLTITNVRAIERLDLRLEPGLTVLEGPNGAGKTSVLEAVHFVLRGSLLRVGAARDLIKRGAGFLRVEAELEGGRRQEGRDEDRDSEEASTPPEGRRRIVRASAAYSKDGERRFTADGAAIADCSRWPAVLAVRSFVPDDLRLIKGSPRRRREYLDNLCGEATPEYTALVRQYDEALSQRNVLLRARGGGGRSSGDALAPWEAILARTGLGVVGRRSETLAWFVPHFQRTHGGLTGEDCDQIRLIYRTNVADMDEAQYRQRLRESRAADEQRTFTHLGPHRDDIRVLRSGLDMHECASQGEQRTALLALVLAEWGVLRATGVDTLLLLDHVMSELDESRRRALIEMVGGEGQTMITTTDLRYFSPAELAASAVLRLDGKDT